MASKNKFQGTYRVGMKVPDERVNRLKADVDKFGSFPQFVDALYDAYLAGEINPSDPTEAAALGLPDNVSPIDEQKLLDAIESAKQSVLSAMTQHATALSSSIQTLQSSASMPASTPAPVPAPAPDPVIQPSIDSAVLESHRDEIIKQILDAHKIELSRLDAMLEEIKNISNAPITPVQLTEVVSETTLPVISDDTSTTAQASTSDDSTPNVSDSPTTVIENELVPSPSRTSDTPVEKDDASNMAPIDNDSNKEEELTMTKEETSSFVDELIGWVSDKDVEAKSEFDMLEFAKAQNALEVDKEEVAPVSIVSGFDATVAPDDETIEEPVNEPETLVSPVESETSTEDTDDEDSFITAEDLDDDIIDGLAAIWGDE